MDSVDPTGVLQRVIDPFKLDTTVEELAKRQRAAGMELVGVKESWGTPFSSVVEVTHRLIGSDGSPRSKPDGTVEAQISRDYFTKRDRGAVAVLPYDPRTREVAMIQEPRPMGLLVGTGGLMLEVPTGGIGKGDKTPADAARREAEKESGLPLLQLTEVASGLLASAGRIDERMFLYVAEVELSKVKDRIKKAAFREIEAEDEQGHLEFIRTIVIGYEKLFNMAETKGQSPLNAATWALATWFKGNHERLAAESVSENKDRFTEKLAMVLTPDETRPLSWAERTLGLSQGQEWKPEENSRTRDLAARMQDHMTTEEWVRLEEKMQRTEELRGQRVLRRGRGGPRL